MSTDKELDIAAREQLKLRKAKKMLLIIGIISIIMMFSGLTSAYIVSKGGAGYWVNITMPDAFWTSTIFMILSSLTIFLATRMARKGKTKLMNVLLVATLGLGLLFVNSQFDGWAELSDKGLYFAVHAAHVGGGILYLIYLVIIGLMGRLGPNNVLKLTQGATYWHFVDILWIYLLLFFYFIH